ncbi:MAG: AsmA-like C-terminal region-containing protein [Cyclobacteriaceae bacterium]
MLKRFAVWIATAIGFAAASLVGLTYVYQDQIIDRLIQSLNQYVATPIQVQHITVSAWRTFPHMAVSFEQVVIAGQADSIQAAEFPLAHIEQVDFSFNLLSLLQGTYEVEQITLSDGSVNLWIDAQRNPNYHIFRRKETEETNAEKAGKLAFRLQQIHLNHIQVRYRDIARAQDVLTNAHQATASLVVRGQIYDITVNGALESEYIEIGADRYFVQQPLLVDTHLMYDYDQQQLAITSAALGLHETQLSIQGLIDHSEETTLDLTVEASQTNITTLLSVLPAAIAQPWKHYRSTGDVHLAGQVQGPADQPAIQLTFGSHNASFFHPDYQRKLENIHLNGFFSNGSERNTRTTELRLEDITATLDGKRISGNLLLRNFRDLYLETNLQGAFSIESLLAFHPVPQLQWAQGDVNADVQLQGKISDLRSNQLHRRRRTHSSGTIAMNDITFALRKSQLPFQQLSGTFRVQDNHLTIQRMSGYVGHSHFSLQGQFRNAIAYALTQTHPIQIDATLHSDFIDLDELLSGNLSMALDTDDLTQSTAQDWRTVAEKQAYQFELSPRLALNFECNIKRLKFRRFRGREIRSTFSVQQQIARIRNLSVQTAGGHAYASALVNAQQKSLRTQGETRLEGIHADSLFYIFEDFQQNFLTARHLKGEVFAKSDWRMTLDRSLRVQYPTLTSETYATIRKGELNNFEPMQRIAPYVDEAQLDHLRFGDIQNYIRIHDQQIYIPTMLVHSNLSDIQVGGTHTFDNHIDYRFEVPMRSIHLRSAKARERTAQRKKDFGEIADDDAAPTKLFLKAQGTVDDYKISYDLPAAKVQFKENLSEEKQELKQVFKNKRKPATYDVELSDEYLDFEPVPQNQP